MIYIRLVLKVLAFFTYYLTKPLLSSKILYICDDHNLHYLKIYNCIKVLYITIYYIIILA